MAICANCVVHGLQLTAGKVKHVLLYNCCMLEFSMQQLHCLPRAYYTYVVHPVVHQSVEEWEYKDLIGQLQPWSLCVPHSPHLRAGEEVVMAAAWVHATTGLCTYNLIAPYAHTCCCTHVCLLLLCVCVHAHTHTHTHSLSLTHSSFPGRLYIYIYI